MSVVSGAPASSGELALRQRGATILSVPSSALTLIGIEFARAARADRLMLVVAAVYMLVMLPLTPRATADARQLASISNDDPLITMQLDGMTVPPYGNPATFLEVQNDSRIPSHWFNIRYFNILYYGGFYLGLAFIVFEPAHLLGAPTFPLGPLILRVLSTLAGLLSLLLLYRFAADHFGTGVALVAVILTATDHSFVTFASTIHPDTLQMALCLLALVIAIRQARIGDLGSVVALGIVVGFVHGTKAGAPFMLPMAALAVLMGARAAHTCAVSIRRFASRLVARLSLFAAVALASFFVSTPYVLFDPYYIDRMQAGFAVLSASSPLYETNFASWFDHLWNDWGLTVGVLMLGGIIWAALSIVVRRRQESNAAVCLAAVLVISNILWYAALGTFWVALYYYLPALALLNVFIGAGITESIRITFRSAVRKRTANFLALVVLAFTILSQNDRVPYLVATIVRGLDLQASSQYLVGNWASRNAKPGSSFLFDDLVYIDPTLFPNQVMNGGMVRYIDVARNEPDYVVLTDYTTTNPYHWAVIKRETQNLGMWDQDPYSVRLYQDLLDRNPTPDQVGPTPISNIELVDVVRPPGPTRDDLLANTFWSCVVHRDWRYAVDPKYRLFGPDCSDGPPLERQVSLYVYHINPDFYLLTPGVADRKFTPITSGTADGYAASNAFDDTGRVWMSDRRGSEANGAYLGIDYGAGRSLPVRAVRVHWVAVWWLPTTIRFEFSDDGATWHLVTTTDLAIPTDPNILQSPSGVVRWDNDFQLPDAGPHRFWRLVAAKVPEGNAFGMDELTFYQAGVPPEP